MSEHPTCLVKPTQVQPTAAREMNIPERVTHAELAAQARAMAPRGGEPTPPAPTVAGIYPPTGAGGPIPAAPKFPTPPPRRVIKE
jgi:hypothetical protein